MHGISVALCSIILHFIRLTELTYAFCCQFVTYSLLISTSISTSGILHVLVSSWDETKSIAVFCKPAGQDETTSSTTYKCLSSSSCKFGFPLQVFVKISGY